MQPWCISINHIYLESMKCSERPPPSGIFTFAWPKHWTLHAKSHLNTQPGMHRQCGGREWESERSKQVSKWWNGENQAWYKVLYCTLPTSMHFDLSYCQHLHMVRQSDFDYAIKYRPMPHRIVVPLRSSGMECMQHPIAQYSRTSSDNVVWQNCDN